MPISTKIKLVEKNLNGFGALGIVAVVAFLIVLVGGGYFAYQRFVKPADTGGVACTLEAALCPDGSYVSRTGPNCEFAQCPVYRPRPCGPLEDRECTADSRIMCSPDGKEKKDVASNCSCGEDARSLEALGWKGCQDTDIDTSTWKTYRNEQYGFEVRYPLELVVDLKNKGFMSGSDYYGSRDFNILIINPKIEPSVSLPTGDVTPTPKYSYDGYNFAFFSGESARKHLLNNKESIKAGKNYSPPIQETTVRILSNSYPLYYVPPSNLPNTDKTSYWFTSFPLGNTSVIVTGNYDRTVLNQILSTFKFLK